MAEYSAGIEEQITSTLRSKGSVTADEIPGILPDEAVRFLRRYAAEHAAEGLVVDGSVLCAKPAAADSIAPGAPRGVVASPVEQVLAAPPGRALLDPAPADRPVSKWMWALPLALGAIGGVVAWLLSRDESPRTARNLFVTGVAVTVLTTCLPLACVLAGAPLGRSGGRYRDRTSGRQRHPG